MNARSVAAFLLLTSLACLIGPGTAAKDKDKDKGSKPAKIKVSEKRGYHQAPLNVSLSTEADATKIRFTTDGSIPTATTGNEYTGPIPIAHTTVLRAAAFRDGSLVSEVDTHSYLFAADVLTQTGKGAPATWGTNQGKPVPADYEMDPEIVGQPAYRDAIAAGLKSLPALCLAMDPADLFGPVHGLYANPLQTGDEWERAASMEFIPRAGTKAAQSPCGVRIQGGWNRRPEESPKHAFRLVFRKKYGAGKLKHPLFERPGTEEFDELILRAGCNNSWLHWSGEERARADYVRDQWMRDSYAAMGHPSARGCFVHLYLNGLYWGLYNLAERPDEHFAAEHFGGNPKDYDAQNGSHVLSGDDLAWKQLIALVNGGVESPAAYRSVQELLDVPSFADFMLLNLYGANADWDRASNWYAARRRSPAGPYRFFVWDGERTLEKVEDNTLAFDDDLSPARLFQKLRQNAEFRLLFADRIQRHLLQDGALSPQAAGERFRSWAEPLNQAIVAESARWGDYRRDVHSYKAPPYELYTRDQHWRPEIDRLLRDYFPRRTAVVLTQFRAAGLYPAVDAPSGRRAEGSLTLSAPRGTIYYTEDGADPRLPGGQAAPGARKYEAPLGLPPGRAVKARAAVGSGSTIEWSALAAF